MENPLELLKQVFQKKWTKWDWIVLLIFIAATIIGLLVGGGGCEVPTGREGSC